MILLDSDHLSVLRDLRHSLRAQLMDKLRICGDSAIYPTAISLEEQMRGWLAELKRRRAVHDHVQIYSELIGLIEFYSAWPVVTFDERAAQIFMVLRAQKIRVGTQDLKIASIAMANDALLLSSNLVDFDRVPGLTVADWLRV